MIRVIQTGARERSKSREEKVRAYVSALSRASYSRSRRAPATQAKMTSYRLRIHPGYPRRSNQARAHSNQTGETNFNSITVSTKPKDSPFGLKRLARVNFVFHLSKMET